MTTVRAELGDLTTYAVDAIVNAANSSLLGGGGVDGAIHRAGGPEILRECKAIVAEIGSLRTGLAVITGAGRLPSRFVVHTVGPIWSQHPPAEADALLASAYRESLRVAVAAGCRTVAFPNISTGVYGFPKDRAAIVATTAVADHIDATSVLDAVTFVCHDQTNLELYRSILG